MDLDSLRFSNLARLGEAVASWQQMTKKLGALAKDAREDLKGTSDKAEWSGLNADVSREFITKTAGEFEDAHTQAKSVYRILNDTHDELVHYRARVQEAVSDADADRVRVRDTGEGTFVVEAKDDADVPQSKVNEHRDRIQEILNRATESDRTAADVLKSLMGQSKYGFSDAAYHDRDQAAKALKDGERAAHLAKDPSKLSAKEFDELNRLLKQNGNDDLFSERFATRLGPRGTLELWQGVNDPRNRDLMTARQGDYDDLQKNLSLTLAHATQSDSPAMQNWERGMVKSGTTLVGHGPPGAAVGFQVMSSLMRYGDYDDTFLTDYGKGLIDEEKRRSANGRDPGWNPALTPQLNHTGTDSGSDPMTGYMKALSRSPAAATEFFNADYVTKDEASDFQDAEGHNLRKSNFQYLFDEREWPQEHTAKGNESVTGKNYLGHALEAATTGHPAGEDPTAENLIHTKGQAELYEDVVKSVSANPDRLNDNAFMSDNLGRMSAEYMPDINRALNPDAQMKDKLYPISGAQAEFDQRDATRFLHTVGRNPEGYAAVNLGQHNYTTHLMEYHFSHPDAYISDEDRTDQQKRDLTVELVCKNAGEMQGIIGAGRAYELEENGLERDAEFNRAMDGAKTWGSSLAGVGVGVTTAPISGPGGIVVGDLTSTASEEVIGSITDGLKRDSSGEVIYRNGAEWDSTQESTYKMVQEGARRAAHNARVPSDYAASLAATHTETGFGSAEDNITKYVSGQGVPSVE